MNKIRDRYRVTVIAVMLLALLMTSCGGKKDEVVHLKFAVFDSNGELLEMVNQFNDSHKDVVIEMERLERNSEPGIADFEGVDKMKREIVTGQGPDIIDFGPLFSATDIIGDYTIDLKPYLDHCKLSLSNQLIEAFAIDGKQSCVPTDVMVLSLEIPASRAIQKNSWTIDELMQEYEKFHVDDSKMLYYGESKLEVLTLMLNFNMGEYIDWNQRTCDFEGEEFKKLLMFANSFPELFDFDTFNSYVESYQNNCAFLFPGGVSTVYDIALDEILLGEEVTYIGYPVQSGNGHMVEPGEHMLAISKSCQYPDSAWEFLQTFLNKSYQEKVDRIPINEEALEERFEKALKTEYDKESGEVIPQYTSYVGDFPEPVEVSNLTKEQIEKVRDLLTGVNKSTGIDWRIYNVILEEVQGYFAGDKSLDEVCSIIQSRVNIYVNEQ